MVTGEGTTLAARLPVRSVRSACCLACRLPAAIPIALSLHILCSFCAYKVDAVRSFLDGTNGCDTPAGWKQYVDASEQANKTTVTPSVELRNVRRSKSMLEGAARRMASISDGSEKSRFSKEQLIGMMREIGALQESIASLSKTVTMVMSREMAAGKTA